MERRQRQDRTERHHTRADFLAQARSVCVNREQDQGRAGIDVFRAISDPTRRALLDLLRTRDRSVNELAEPFHMTQPAISQHLRVLRHAGLVRPQQIGRQRVYRLNAKPLRQVRNWAAHYERFWQKKLNQSRERGGIGCCRPCLIRSAASPTDPPARRTAPASRSPPPLLPVPAH